MANELAAFLAENTQRKNLKVAVSARFKDVNGDPVLWELCPLSAGDMQDILAAGNAAAEFSGKGRRQRELLVALLAKSVVTPDLTAAELQDSYGVMGAEQLLLAMLSPGEFSALERAFVSLNMDCGLSELTDKAKN